MSKKVFMIAGPNGAGKTTVAFTLIPELRMLYEFINADEIAKGLAPLHPESMALTASKLMLKRLKELLIAKKSFAFETTGAGTNYLRHLEEAKKAGYETNLIFLWLANPDQAIKRVAQRVSQGGHNIPEEVVKRRYFAGLKNLVKHYLPLVDNAIVLNNSLFDTQSIIARKTCCANLKIENPHIWKEILKVTND